MGTANKRKRAQRSRAAARPAASSNAAPAGVDVLPTLVRELGALPGRDRLRIAGHLIEEADATRSDELRGALERAAYALAAIDPCNRVGGLEEAEERGATWAFEAIAERTALDLELEAPGLTPASVCRAARARTR